MSQEWRNSVNQTIGSQRIGDINEYRQSIDYDDHAISAIDIYYKTNKEILEIAKTPKILEDNKVLGPLLFVGIVSNTENYFRDIFARVIQICPISQATCASQNICLGSVIWHLKNNVERGLFENISFADADTIKKTCKKYLDYDIEKKSATAAALEEFDKICELRHGIVHSNSIIAGKNALKLGIKSNNKALKISIGYKQLQECALICTTLVTSFNTELFTTLVKRWAVDWTKLPSWDTNNDNALFNIIWKTFSSTIDNFNGTIQYKTTMQRCRNLVKKEFNR